jgi:hypothetical protein
VSTANNRARFSVDSTGTIFDSIGTAPNAVVLGRHPAYLNEAQRSGARTFDVGDAWSQMAARTDRFGGMGDGSEVWIRNQRFLDKNIVAGAEFRLASDPFDEFNKGSFFMREIAYLRSKGYRLTEDGTQMMRKSP